MNENIIIQLNIESDGKYHACVILFSHPIWCSEQGMKIDSVLIIVYLPITQKNAKRLDIRETPVFVPDVIHVIVICF